MTFSPAVPVPSASTLQHPHAEHATLSPQASRSGGIVGPAEEEDHGDGSEAQAYTVSDLKGQREDLGFTQPVASDRLTLIDLLLLMAPSEETPTRILLNVRGEDRSGTVVNQYVDGRVKIRFDHDGSEEFYDLSQAKYKWIS